MSRLVLEGAFFIPSTLFTKILFFMMTVSQLNEHAASLDIDGMVGENSLAEAKGVEDILGKVCGIYGKVRPFLEVVGTLFFIPKKWRTAILSFVAVMDGLCPAISNPELS